MKKLNEFGYTKFEVLVVVLLLGIVAFVTINKTSYAFEIDKTNNTKEMVNLIEIQAKEYALDNLDLFKDTDTTYISVNNLVEGKYLPSNSKGLVVDPSDNSKSYNDSKIKLEYNKEKNEVLATFVG